jgi:TonB family protein
MLERDHILLSDKPTPSVRASLLSGFLHVITLILIGFYLRIPTALIVPDKIRAVEIVSGRSQLSFKPMKSNPSRLHVPRTREHQSRREAPKAETAVAGEESGAVLREHAKKATAAIMMNIRQRMEFGFSPSDYQLPTQTAGIIPLISAGELPPRYEQYLVVEVTIDREGRVAEARITTGDVDSKIQEKVLSAIRKFKYIPAKHNGSPIPSQLDIVVHVPNDV